MELDVEPMVATGLPRKRTEVVKALATLLVMRRCISLRKGTSQEGLPKSLNQLAGQRFDCRVKATIGKVKKRPSLRFADVLQTMKLNDEPYDHCSLRVQELLALAESEEERTWKAYFIVRTYSRDALELQALSQPWQSLESGIRACVKETKEPAKLFTSSFGPNNRRHNECAALGSVASQRLYVLDTLLEGAGALQGVSWQGLGKLEVFQQLMTWKGCGPLTAKNAYQVLRPWHANMTGRAAAGRRAGKKGDDRFALTAAGCRYAVNLLLAEPGGPTFDVGGKSTAVLKHFSVLVSVLHKAYTKQWNTLGRQYPALKKACRELCAEDENDFVFHLCESWKSIAFDATRNTRYLRWKDGDDPEADDLEE